VLSLPILKTFYHHRIRTNLQINQRNLQLHQRSLQFNLRNLSINLRKLFSLRNFQLSWLCNLQC
jgi:hypothetical protein